MFNALSTAATGLEAQQTRITSIANDLANVNTDGYKSSTTEFEELLSQTMRAPGEQMGNSTVSPVGVQVGSGVKLGAIVKNFSQGPTKMTYHPFDIAIQGSGFFQVQLPTGEIAYTRKGAFKLDPTGALVGSNGSKLIPAIVIPPNATSFTVTQNGGVSASFADGTSQEIGQIQITMFQNPQGLLTKSEGNYRPTLASGQPVEAVPGESGSGTLQQGALEGSNVNVANSMVEMISAQRSYEMGAKVMTTVDQMLGATVNIR
jgi:flagellar basal-body rod protein FlgG